MARYVYILATAFVLMAMSVPAWSQALGHLKGYVTNSKGQPIYGATVKILGTTPARGAITKEDGSYHIRPLIAGIYDIQVTCVGFRPYICRGIIINPGDTTMLDCNLAGSEYKEIACPPRTMLMEKFGTITHITFDR